MDRTLHCQTLAIINRVNKLIEDVDFLLTTTANDLSCFDDELCNLGRWGAEICAYVKAENEMGLIDELATSAPLYLALLQSNLSQRARNSVSAFCKMMADLREWSKEQPIKEQPLKRKVGRPTLNENKQFIDYILHTSPEHKAAVVLALEGLITSADNLTEKICILRAACDARIMNRPNRKVVERTFNLSFSAQLYSKVFSLTPTKKIERLVEYYIAKITNSGNN